MITSVPDITPDLSGKSYYRVLEQIHNILKPKTYLEVGVRDGVSFALANCASIGIDPKIDIKDPTVLTRIMGKPKVMLFNMTSDAFFVENNPAQLFGHTVDMVFLDGMHRSEFLLRDFVNTEAYCRPNSIIALHDCIPPDAGITARVYGQRRSPAPHRFDWWAGDVWRTSLLLKRHRPDLKMTVVDAAPTGLVLITNLDPTSRKLREGYAGYVDEMLSWSLDEIGISALFNEMHVEPTSAIETDEQITARFWL